MNAARLDRSARLQATLAALRAGLPAGPTTLEIQLKTGSMAVHSDIAELRANGIPVTCVHDRDTSSGRRVSRWRVGEKAEGAA